jgi:carboxylesterase type B
MTVCEDKAGIEESVRMAKEWIAQNAAHIGADAPKVSLGTIIIHATK